MEFETLMIFFASWREVKAIMAFSSWLAFFIPPVFANSFFLEHSYEYITNLLELDESRIYIVNISLHLSLLLQLTSFPYLQTI